MIVDKILTYLEGEGKTLDVNLLESFGIEAMHGFKRQFLEEKESKRTLRLSSLGKCARQQAYGLSEMYEAEPISGRTMVTFFMGDILEAMVVSLAKVAGVNVHSEQAEVKHLGITGHIDGIITTNSGEDVLLELKSMSDFAFKTFQKNGIDDSWGYVSQINSYMAGLGLKKAVLVGVNKNTGHLHEQVLTPSEGILEKIEFNLEQLLDFQDCGSMPSKAYLPEAETFRRKPTGKYKLPINCAYCSYKQYCWTYTTEVKSGRPVFYVTRSS